MTILKSGIQLLAAVMKIELRMPLFIPSRSTSYTCSPMIQVHFPASPAHQTVPSQTPLSTKNCFAPLTCDPDSENESLSTSVESRMVLNISTLTLPNRRRCPKWERCLPPCFVVASTPGEQSLELPVEIQTTNTCQ